APATSLLYPLSLHDALPIYTTAAATIAPTSVRWSSPHGPGRSRWATATGIRFPACPRPPAPPVRRHRHRAGRVARECAGRCRRRSEEHTSELQSRENLVCRL